MAARAQCKGCLDWLYAEPPQKRMGGKARQTYPVVLICEEASDWLDSMKEAPWLAEPLKKKIPGKKLGQTYPVMRG